MTRWLGRLGLFLAGALALYALPNYVHAHHLDTSYRYYAPDWAAKMAYGEALLDVGWLLVGTFAAVLFARAIGAAGGDFVGRLLAHRRAPLVLAAAAVVVTIAIGASFHHAQFLPEETGCDFAGRALLRGRLATKSPPDPGLLEYPWVADAGGRRFGVCGHGQAAVAAVGRAVHAPWLVPAFLVGAIVLLCAGLARDLHDDPETTGVAALLAAISPAILVTGTTIDPSLTVTLLCLAMVRFAVALGLRGRRRDAILLGLAFGLGLLVKALPVVFVAAALVAVGAWRERSRLRLFLRELAPAVGVALPLAVLAIGANLATTGRPLQSPLWRYITAHWPGALVLGFGRAPFDQAPHTALTALGQLGSSLLRLNGWALGWPLSLAPLALLWLVRGRGRDAVLLLPCAALAILAWLLTAPSSGATGPLVLLPTVPLVGVASSRLVRDLRPRFGGWPLAVALGATLAAAGGFWRTTVLHEVGDIARGAAAMRDTPRYYGVKQGLIVYARGTADYVPPALSLDDPLVYVPEGEQILTVRGWFPGRHAWRYLVWHTANGELIPLD